MPLLLALIFVHEMASGQVDSNKLWCLWTPINQKCRRQIFQSNLERLKIYDSPSSILAGPSKLPCMLIVWHILNVVFINTINALHVFMATGAYDGNSRAELQQLLSIPSSAGVQVVFFADGMLSLISVHNRSSNLWVRTSEKLHADSMTHVCCVHTHS